MSSREAWKSTPNSHVHLLEKNRLRKNTTSQVIRMTTPVLVSGAGVTGTFKGAGVTQYWRILNASPARRMAVAA